MHRSRMSAALLTAVLCIALAGCGDDSPPNGPSPQPEPAYEIVLNALVTDSLGGQSFVMMVFAPDSIGVRQTIPFGAALVAMTSAEDGLRIFVSRTYPKPYTIWSSSWPPTDTLANHIGLAAGQLLLSADEQYLLAGSGHAVLYALPGLNPVYIDSANADGGVFLPGRTAFCYHRFMNDTLIIVDYGTTPMTVQRPSLRGSDDKPLAILGFCPSAGGDSLVIAAMDIESNINYMLVVATDDLAFIDQVTITPSFVQTIPVVDPGGRYTYWLYKGSPWPTPTPGAVYRYDIRTKTLSTVLDDSHGALDTYISITLTPDGKYLYAVSSYRLYRVLLSDGETDIVDTLGLGGHENFVMMIRPIN